jgi:hypothetical protein
MSAQGKPVRSGTESMLRSLGMGEILEAAKSLADNGTLNKILTFADHAESIVKQIAELNANVSAMRAELRYIGGRTESVEPGAYPSDGGPFGNDTRSVLGAGSDGDARPEQAGRDGAAHIGSQLSDSGTEDAA